MIFIRLIRFLLGYVCFEASGGFPERFINLCANNGVPLWDVRNAGGKLRASTTIKGYKKIRKPAKKSGMLPHLTGKNGLPFIIHLYKMRVGLAVGAVAAVILLSLMSLMVWNVEVVGNEKIPTETILQELESLGVKRGVLRSNIDAKFVEKEMMKLHDTIVWSALNILSSSASFDMRERMEPPEMLDVDSPCNVIAAHDGEIVRMEAYRGRAVTGVGSAVVKGDLLISGVIQTKYHNQYAHAKGSVIARTTHKFSSETPLIMNAKTVSYEKIRSIIYLFGIKIPLGLSEEADEYTKSEKMLDMNGKALPIGIIRERFTKFSESSVEIGETKASLISMLKYFEEYENSVSHTHIISESVKKEVSAEKYLLSGEYKVEEDIAEEQYFEINENETIINTE